MTLGLDFLSLTVRIIDSVLTWTLLDFNVHRPLWRNLEWTRLPWCPPTDVDTTLLLLQRVTNLTILPGDSTKSDWILLTSRVQIRGRERFRLQDGGRSLTWDRDVTSVYWTSGQNPGGLRPLSLVMVGNVCHKEREGRTTIAGRSGVSGFRLLYLL